MQRDRDEVNVLGVRFEAINATVSISLGVPFEAINATISTALGLACVNDFPNEGRLQRAAVQAEAPRARSTTSSCA